MTENTKILFYGTNWCGDCRRALKIFGEHNIEFTFINIDQDPAGEAFVKSKNRGNRSVPTIIFTDGSILVEPSNDELIRRLETLI